MSNIIDKKSLVNDEEINKAFKGIADHVSLVTKSLSDIVAEAKKVNTELGGGNSLSKLVDITNKNKKATDELNTAQKESEKIQKELANIAIKKASLLTEESKALAKAKAELKALVDAQKEEVTHAKALAEAKRKEIQSAKELASAQKESTKVSAEERAALQSVSRETKLIAQFNTAAEGSYDKLNAKYQLNILKLNAMSVAERESSDAAKLLVKESNALYVQMSKLDQATGRHQRSVGDYGKAFNGLQFQVTQLARELPALAYGPQMFMAAISNNFPMLQDEIARTRIENEKLRAEGKKGIPVWKQMAGAITSWQTAVVVAITAYMLFSKEINNWAASLFKGKNAVEDLKLAQERLNEANKRGYEDGQQELVHARLLYEATQSATSSIEDKHRAVKELQEDYPDYLGNFSEEEIIAGKASMAYNQLATAIMNAARARAYQDIIVENEVKKYEKEQEILKKRTELAVAAERLVKEQKMFDNMDVEGQKTYAAKLLVSENTVKGLTEDINRLNTEISQIEFSSKELADKITVTDLTFDGGKKDKGNKSKGNEFTELEQLQERHKKELDETAKYQQELLSLKTLSDDQLALADKDNAKEILMIRMQQIEEEKKIKGLSKEQIAELDSELAEVRKDLAKTTADYIIDEEQRIAKEREDRLNAESEAYMAETEHKISLEEVRLNELAKADIEKVKNAKDAADKIRTIEYELSLAILRYRKQEYEAAIASNNLTIEDKQKYKEEIDKINVAIAENAVDQSKQSVKVETKDNREKIRSLGDAVNEGINFTSQLYANQEAMAKKAYENELAIAGDNIEAKTIAERKYEEEMRKIRRRQAIADKAQALFNIGLTLATASAKLNAFQIIAATLAMATVLAKPIPEFALGTDDAPETFIAGEKGVELIEKPDGTKMLTPDKPTLFSDKSFIGSKILPHDKTAQMLNAYAISQGNQIFVDMSKTNSHLETIAKNTKGQEQRSYDATGRLTVKRNNSITHYN